jgi:geranylgeranyl diphosphate synthase, type II
LADPTLNPRAAPAALRAWLEGLMPVIEGELERQLAIPEKLPPTDPAYRLCEGMRYAALGPGKRLRPALCLGACAAVGGAESDALPAAAALELLHAYTLVHDDLPAMDDDDVRRGRPTVHRAFDEATAILVGDALLTRAFGALAEIGGVRAAEAVKVLAARAGAAELLAGQARDLAQPPSDLGGLEAIHRGKTGALFAAAAELGGICGGADAAVREALARYGMTLGVAFQHADDRDDDEHPMLRARASDRIESLAGEAEQLARGLGPTAAPLVTLAAWIRSKAHEPA